MMYSTAALDADHQVFAEQLAATVAKVRAILKDPAAADRLEILEEAVEAKGVESLVREFSKAEIPVFIEGYALAAGSDLEKVRRLRGIFEELAGDEGPVFVGGVDRPLAPVNPHLPTFKKVADFASDLFAKKENAPSPGILQKDELDNIGEQLASMCVSFGIAAQTRVVTKHFMVTHEGDLLISPEDGDKTLVCDGVVVNYAPVAAFVRRYG